MMSAKQQLIKEIREAYIFLREKNQTIPSDTLEFIRDASIEAVNKLIDITEHDLESIQVLSSTQEVLEWHTRDENPPEKLRIVIFSPDYEKNDPMRLRFIDSQFFRISKDAQYWAVINEPNF